MPLNLDDLREELETLNPQVVEGDADIAVALEVKEAATEAYEKSKIEVRRLKAIRDPLRVQQMLLQKVIGDIDPETPESQTVTSNNPLDTSMADVQTITSNDVADVDPADLGGE